MRSGDEPLDPLLSPYLHAASTAAAWAYAAAFISVTLLGMAGGVLARRAGIRSVTQSTAADSTNE